LLEAEPTPGHSAAARMRSAEKSNYFIVNWTSDLTGLEPIVPTSCPNIYSVPIISYGELLFIIAELRRMPYSGKVRRVALIITSLWSTPEDCILPSHSRVNLKFYIPELTRKKSIFPPKRRWVDNIQVGPAGIECICIDLIDWATVTCRRNECQLLWIEGCRVVSAADALTVVNLSFLDRSRDFSFK
jgi:hypothetical protein